MNPDNVVTAFVQAQEEEENKRKRREIRHREKQERIIAEKRQQEEKEQLEKSAEMLFQRFASIPTQGELAAPIFMYLLFPMDLLRF